MAVTDAAVSTVPAHPAQTPCAWKPCSTRDACGQIMDGVMLTRCWCDVSLSPLCAEEVAHEVYFESDAGKRHCGGHATDTGMAATDDEDSGSGAGVVAVGGALGLGGYGSGSESEEEDRMTAAGAAAGQADDPQPQKQAEQQQEQRQQQHDEAHPELAAAEGVQQTASVAEQHPHPQQVAEPGAQDMDMDQRPPAVPAAAAAPSSIATSDLLGDDRSLGSTFAKGQRWG